ncbi:hypothetical protein [Paenibacillus antarcticus]|uniref:hypothetical protein n=1 Tax=Paenibacillus antarcticus TaxID=253703 RepID=UPI000AF36F75|nr:hypothetical protein [Paenibacillus antarcticus]
MRKKEQKFITRSHFRIIDGEEVEIVLSETDIPDRCKLIWTEIMTGNKYELVEG